jgi:flap endonuclease-1
MGIKNLNKYLVENCKNSIQQMHLSHFAGKTIVIDTSIYMHQYKEENALIENMYLLICTLLYYGITPIFVFDGKPPSNKQETIKLRNLEKEEAKIQYENECLKLENVKTEKEKNEIQKKMSILKSKFIKILKDDLQNVKKLMELLKIQYIEATSEADDICAKMVITNQACACLSEDMDLFVYGCSRIIRNINLATHNCTFYNLNGILNELNLSLINFREIIILCGTDYNENIISLKQSFQYFEKYKTSETQTHYYVWLKQIVPSIEIDKLNEILKIFEIKGEQDTPLNRISIETEWEPCNQVSQKGYFQKYFQKINKKEMEKWLNNFGFIFV